MLHSPILIPPSAAFWPEVARALLTDDLLATPRFGSVPVGRNEADSSIDLSSLRIVVPTFFHAGLLQTALANRIKAAFIPPRITTLSAWLNLLPPDSKASGGSERLMALYAELRQHAWLKKLFGARRNPDLLPLAQTLLGLCDELSAHLLPGIDRMAGSVERRWQAALEKLSPAARNLLSNEAQLVWSIWKTQLDGKDPCAIRLRQLTLLAQRVNRGSANSIVAPLIWIAPVEPTPMEQSFLNACASYQPVLPILLDWRATAIHPAYALAWPELTMSEIGPNVDAHGATDSSVGQVPDSAPLQTPTRPAGFSLCPSTNLEQEAMHAAQIVIDWLQAGKSEIAIIAQDRVSARRLRALLERAQVLVIDETGWTLSTTRAAAGLAAWFDVVASRAETVALLDFLKSPFLLAGNADKPALVMTIEHALLRENALGGWEAMQRVLAASLDTGNFRHAREAAALIAAQADLFGGRKSITQWSMATRNALQAMDMLDALSADAAGAQVVALLDAIRQDGAEVEQMFSFSEWRAFVSLHLENTTFIPPRGDNRVRMMPLSGARLRSFDAVLIVGTDAEHLPSHPNETLFFSDAVRRELGLATRESFMRQQLRDFTELLSFNSEVVACWQSSRDGEANPVSPWIERLQLVLERAGSEKIPLRQVTIAQQKLQSTPPMRPAPSAPHLLPEKLSASGYNSFIACPYQFFATRMLGLSGLDELSDMPQKRDYGEWLHEILHLFHNATRDEVCTAERREQLLREISDRVFAEALEKNAATLSFYARWQKVIPAYLEWAGQREADGWRFVIGEEWKTRLLEWPGGQILLHGRVDRTDQNADGERAVLDYKTSALSSLRDRLRQGEDHQLAFYGLLTDSAENPVVAAHYVSLELSNSKSGDIAADRFPERQGLLEKHLASGLQAISRGAPLPANGIEVVCQYCEVRGLCRKGAW
ncbi:hypothetical protein BH11PSE11_BH11PSE11_18210 [soil metagenome]